MKALSLPALLLVILCWLAVPQRAEAATGLSQLTYNPDNNLVQGYSRTELTYDEAYYYDAAVEGYLYQAGSLVHYNFGQGDQWASVNTEAFGVPDVRYALYSDHYVGAFFFECSTVTIYDECGTVSYYDPFGFSNYPSPEYYGGFNYFYALPACYVYYSYIYLGTTDVALVVPSQQPSCPNVSVNIRATFAQGRQVNGTTQTALVGGAVQLEAEVVGGSSDGTFRWSATGDARTTDTGGIPLPANIYNVYWTSEGTKTVTVEFTPSGSNCRATASVNINNRIPTVDSFTAQQVAAEVDCGNRCIGEAPRATFSLGCLSGGIQGGRQDAGISFEATMRAPAEGYISAPGDAKFKFVQIVNPYTKVREQGSAVFQCQTRRTSESDTSTGWMLDTSDPYSPSAQALGSFTSLSPNVATISTVDAPGLVLDDYDYAFVDERFEMYVIYYTGNPVTPTVSRALGVLPWRWGGEVVYDGSNASCPYFMNYSLEPPRFITGRSSINMQTPYQGNVRELIFGACQGEPEPDPEPFPDPCWNGEYFTCD